MDAVALHHYAQVEIPKNFKAAATEYANTSTLDACGAHRACHTTKHSSMPHRRMSSAVVATVSLRKTLDETGAFLLQTAVFTLPGGGGNV